MQLIHLIAFNLQESFSKNQYGDLQRNLISSKNIKGNLAPKKEKEKEKKWM